MCVCERVSDWFLFYGLASRVLVIRRNKSALFDLSVNSNKIHFTAGQTPPLPSPPHTGSVVVSGHSWPLDSIYKDTERETFSASVSTHVPPWRW